MFCDDGLSLLPLLIASPWTPWTASEKVFPGGEGKDAWSMVELSSSYL
jgi:hypothetical protein